MEGVGRNSWWGASDKFGKFLPLFLWVFGKNLFLFFVHENLWWPLLVMSKIVQIFPCKHISDDFLFLLMSKNVKILRSWNRFSLPKFLITVFLVVHSTISTFVANIFIYIPILTHFVHFWYCILFFNRPISRNKIPKSQWGLTPKPPLSTPLFIYMTCGRPLCISKCLSPNTQIYKSVYTTYTCIHLYVLFYITCPFNNEQSTSLSGRQNVGEVSALEA